MLIINCASRFCQFARTLICQGTLAPLIPIALPTFWQYDAALTLYPLPDLVVIGDPSQGFQTTQQGCTILNTVSVMGYKNKPLSGGGGITYSETFGVFSINIHLVYL